MTPWQQKRRVECASEHWQDVVDKWQKVERVVLFHEAQLILCRTACRGAGVPLEESQVKQRAEDFGAIVDAFGAVGPGIGKDDAQASEPNRGFARSLTRSGLAG